MTFLLEAKRPVHIGSMKLKTCSDLIEIAIYILMACRIEFITFHDKPRPNVLPPY
jgi:hypothetical protein